MSPGPSIAAAAYGLVGTPYRLHGRDPATGLDCVGLVLAAARVAGVMLDAPQRYSLRTADISACLAWFEQPGLALLAPHTAPCPGDIAAVRPSHTQLHLMIFAGSGLVHAHAGLRRTVMTPLPAPWPVWRRMRVSDRNI